MYRIPDSPDEPDEMNIFPYYEPLNIPIDDISGDIPTICNYVHIPWLEPKSEQRPIVEMVQQKSSSVYSGNQFNWVMPPDVTTGIVPPNNNVYNIPTDQILMNNQMLMGEHTPQPAQSFQQQRIPPQNLVGEVQWTGPPRPSMVHNKHFNHWQLNINHGPPHFERDGGAGVRYSSGGYCDLYRGKVNRVYPSGNRGGPYNFRGAHPRYGIPIRICKYFANQGFCNIINCKFLH